jgi:hypothetical protein
MTGAVSLRLMASTGGDLTGVAPPPPAGLADLRRVLLRLSMLSVGLLCCSLYSPLLSSLEIVTNYFIEVSEYARGYKLNGSLANSLFQHILIVPKANATPQQEVDTKTKASSSENEA